MSRKNINNRMKKSLEDCAGRLSSVCVEHNKYNDIYCIEQQCGLLVCDVCGLFGKHKGHKLVQKNELDRLTREMVADARKLHSDICETEQRFSQNTLLAGWRSFLDNDRFLKEKDINEHFDVRSR